jgi:RecG-like helicase
MRKRAKSPEKRRAVKLYNRLVARMPKMLTEKQSRAIDEINRGEHQNSMIRSPRDKNLV